MKSDVFHAYDPTSVRESVLGVRISSPSFATIPSTMTSNPQIGYKPPFSSDLIRFSEWLERQNDDIPRIATPCRICPQYGHALIFPRKCYYEAQCPLPLLFCAIHHGGRPIRTSFVRRGFTHPSAQNFLRRLSSTLSKRLAKNDPTKQRTNFGWMKYGPDHIVDDEVPNHLKYDRGSR
jgi:hypothetical protein